MGKLVRLVVVVLLLAVCRAALAVTWYVDGAVSSSGDGKSWETAFQMIQEGIDAASHGDKVIVAEGTYVENVHFNGKNIVLTSTGPLDPKVVESTIIDGNQAGSVVTFDGTEDETCLFSGFTVLGGSARDGGGINGGTHVGDHSLAAMKNNVIRGNSAWDSGGGLVYCDGAIVENTIAGNTARFNGGGHYCPVISQTTSTG